MRRLLRNELIVNLPRHPLAGKTARTLLLFLALALLPYAWPSLNRYRVLVPAPLAGLLGVRAGLANDAQSIEPDSLQSSAGDSATGERVSASAVRAARPGEIEDPSGHALDAFFAALAKTESGAGQTRVCHYGDSPITNDGITSTVRRLLQQRFGDAGHGFILIDKPWGWYGHVGVAHEASRGWQSDPMFISKGEHYYGLGGVSFVAEAANVTASFATVADGDTGHSVAAFDVYYLARPGGGDFEAMVDGGFNSRVSTAGDVIESGFQRISVDEGAHQLTIRTVGNGPVQLFGVVLESGRVGVEYDSLGVNGAFIGLLAHYLDADHWAEQLRHRRPDLVVIGYGANESQFERLPMDQYEQDTRDVIRRIRAALPGVSILLVGPMDRGMRGAGGQLVTRPMIPKLIAYQRRLAAETGCAFFDTFSAMGGEGTVARWFDAKPRLMGGDFTHPTWQGAEIVGALINDAIVKAYEEHKGK